MLPIVQKLLVSMESPKSDKRKEPKVDERLESRFKSSALCLKDLAQNTLV